MSTDSPPLEPWETDEWRWFYESRQVVTEADWASCPHAGALIDYVNQMDRISRRKFFLAGAACVRRVWNLLSRESRAAVEAAEQYADGRLSEDELCLIHAAAEAAYRQWPEDDPRFLAGLAVTRLSCDPRRNHGNAEHTMYVAVFVPETVGLMTGAPRQSDAWAAAWKTEMRALADVYRCVLGNPFRPRFLDPRCRTEAVLSLARGVYESRDFAAAPVLADALEEAECGFPDLLGHCRGSGPHARGCWAVDLVLGEE
jgi:hypothetical protein